MAKGRLSVRVKRRKIPPLYLLKPSELFSLFEEKIEEALSQLNMARTTNRALQESLRRKGIRKLKELRSFFEELDKAPLNRRKLAYNAFYRLFQRYQWALESGSEKEIELKVWVTSSIDYLTTFAKTVRELEDA